MAILVFGILGCDPCLAEWHILILVADGILEDYWVLAAAGFARGGLGWPMGPLVRNGLSQDLLGMIV
jgi:hypothetical protein